MATSKRWRWAGVGALCGVALGITIATIEVLYVAWSIRGAGFRPMLLVYGAIIDGGALGVLGLILGVLWSVVGGRRAVLQRRQVSGSESGDLVSLAATVCAEEPQDMPLSAKAPARRMSRRDALRIFGSTAAAGALALVGLAYFERGKRSVIFGARNGAASSPVPGTESVVQRPNILLITIDTLRADQTGAYYHPYVRTPALDLLSEQGARFRWHLCEQPQTNPSHASIFTGMYPTSNGLRVHMVDHLSDSVDTLAGIYRHAGYTTVGLYSWMSFDPPYSNLQRGFDVYQNVAAGIPGALSNPLLQQLAARYRVAEEYLALPKLANKVVGLKRQVETEAKGRADLTTEAGLVELEALSGQPFFLWVHYFDPHYPYQPPEPYLDLYDSNYQGPIDSSMNTIMAVESGELRPTGPDLVRLMSFYQAAITFADVQIGRLLSALDILGLSENTIVVVTADHGESFNEHAGLYVRGDFFHPHSLYNAELRVPLIIRYPDRIRPGTIVDGITESVDLLPTLLEMSGLPAAQQVQGRSLLDMLSGSSDEGRVAFATIYDYAFSSTTTDGWKLILNQSTGQLSLFDLSNDPDEQRDVASQQAELVRELAAKLEAWMRQERIQ